VLIGSDLNGCKTFIFKLILMDFGDEKMMMMLEENSNELLFAPLAMFDDGHKESCAWLLSEPKLTFPWCCSHLPEKAPHLHSDRLRVRILFGAN
jgi:hypothetical protein